MQIKEDSQAIRIAVCDSTRMGTQLLAEVLARDQRFSVMQVHNPAEVLNAEVDIALISATINGESTKGCELGKQFRVARPQSQVIILTEALDRDSVLEIFRSGARGIFCRSGALSTLNKCITTVHAGQVWAGNSEIQILLEALEEPVKLKLVDTKGKVLLSKREQELARWVVEGLTNREIALRMHLSEHTVKNYLFRIFDKLGISNRVELILYAFSQLSPAPTASQSHGRATQLATASSGAGWCRKDQCAVAPFALGEMYNDGQKVPRDARTAFMWFLIAEALAVDILDRSKSTLAALRMEMTPDEVEQAEARAVDWVRSKGVGEGQPSNDLSASAGTSSSKSSAAKSKRNIAHREAVAS